MNLEKHVKRPVEEWMFADSSLVPSHTRSARIIGHYIKDKKCATQGAIQTPLDQCHFSCVWRVFRPTTLRASALKSDPGSEPSMACG